MSEILEETNERVSGGHVVLLCKCHECGDTFNIQRRRFLKTKPCGMCIKRKQNAWKPFLEKIDNLKQQLSKAQADLKLALAAMKDVSVYCERLPFHERYTIQNTIGQTLKQIKEKKDE